MGIAAFCLLASSCASDDDAGEVSAEPESTDSSAEQGETAGQEETTEFGERVLRFHTVTAPDDPWHQALEMFAEEVESNTNGQVQVDTFCCGELAADSVKEIESVGTGDIDGSFITAGVLPNFNEKAAVFMLPFIAPDAATYHRLLDEFGPELWEEILPPLGLHPIVEATSNQGFRQLTNSVHSVRAPDDLADLRIRMSATDIWRDVVTTLGADAISMPFGDLPGALQQGVVDGQENPLNLIDAAGLSDFQDHVTIWNYAANPLVFVVNSDLWESLEPELQEVITEAATTAAAWHRERYVEIDASLVEEMEDDFETVDVLTPEELQAFRDAVTPVYEEWSGVLGEELVAEFERVATGD